MNKFRIEAVYVLAGRDGSIKPTHAHGLETVRRYLYIQMCFWKWMQMYRRLKGKAFMYRHMRVKFVLAWKNQYKNLSSL